MQWVNQLFTMLSVLDTWWYTGSCRCGVKKTSRIVGGAETEVHSIPFKWMNLATLPICRITTGERVPLDCSFSFCRIWSWRLCCHHGLATLLSIYLSLFYWFYWLSMIFVFGFTDVWSPWSFWSNCHCVWSCFFTVQCFFCVEKFIRFSRSCPDCECLVLLELSVLM